MRHRPQLPLVLVADLVQHEPLAMVEPDPHPPPLPAKLVALKRERRTFGLSDLERSQVIALRQTRHQLRSVLAHYVRQPGVVSVLKLEQLHPVDVDDRPQSPDEVRVRIRCLAGAHPHIAPRHAPVAIRGRDERLRIRPRVDEDQIEIVDPTPRQRVDHIRVLPNQLVTFVVLLDSEVGLDSRPLLDVSQFAGAQIDSAFVNPAVAAVPDDGSYLPRERLPGPPLCERGLRGLDQLDGCKPPLVPARVTLADQRDGARDLLCAQRI